MKKIILIMASALWLFAGDILVKKSCVSVDETAQNIKNIIEKKDLTLFAVVDHGANASAVNMALGDSKLLIFGSPKMGTLLMLEEKKAGLDLPLKILVYKDEDKSVKMAYRDAASLANTHQIDKQKIIAKIDGAMEKITTKASQCSKD